MHKHDLVEELKKIYKLGRDSDGKFHLDANLLLAVIACLELDEEHHHVAIAALSLGG